MNKRLMMPLLAKVVASVVSSHCWAAGEQSCPSDSVRSGTVCIDKYEASVWETTDPALIRKIRQGTANALDLAAGAVQHGASAQDYDPGCPQNGNGCVNFYAVSVKSVTPSRFITWFQAAAAARNAHKRLPTNAEWQVAASGTPDPGTDDGSADCNIVNNFGHEPAPTFSRARCVSDVGAFDMIGNLMEWVAEWVPRSTNCLSDAELFAGTGDMNCLAGADTTSGPAALQRGGNFGSFASAGNFTVNGRSNPHNSDESVGFRAVRDAK